MSNENSSLTNPMKTIYTSLAPKPVGHYSQAIIHNGIVYVAGQLPIDPKTNEKSNGSIEEQTKLLLSNIAEILDAADSDMDHILKTTIYITDLQHRTVVNDLYAKALGDHKPARIVLPLKELPYGLLIEMEVIAAVKDA